MNELSGRYVNVVLSVEEGRGMDFLKNHVQIVTNFNGRILESDLIEPEECPLFNTELVWETEKKDLRKIRSANSPLRLDVQTFDSSNKKIRIGYLLLNPRSASIIPKHSKAEIPFKWHKLLGVPAEYKSSHPEIFLSLTVRDHVPEVQEQPQVGSCVSDQIIEEENESSSEEVSEKIAPVFPVKYFEDGYIQVGEDNKISRSFFLSINIKNATSLDLLLPEVLVFTNNREKYYLSFSMFGIVIKTKPFWRELHQNIVLNEKVVVSLLSSYEVLKAFFEEHCEILVRFYCGRDKLGMTKVNVQNLFAGGEEKKFYSVTEHCRFKYPSPHGIIPVGAKGRKPSIEVEATLEAKDLPPHVVQKMRESADGQHDQNDFEYGSGDDVPKEDKAQFSSPRSSIRSSPIKETVEETETAKPKSPIAGASGEQVEMSEKEIEKEVLHSPISEQKSASVHDIASGRKECVSTKSETTLLENVPGLNLASPKVEVLTTPKDHYRKYRLDIVMDRICWKMAPKTTHFFVKFKHPKANTSFLINTNINDYLGEDIPLMDVKCRIFYISTTEDIRKLLYAWPAKVQLTDENQKDLTEEVCIYTAAFLAKDRIDCTYQTELKTVKVYEPLAKIGITMSLHEHSLADLKLSEVFDLQPEILDEKLAVKELKELHEWKSMEQKRFVSELKVLQQKHITVLQKDWIKRKNELEAKLCKNVAKIKVLKKDLQTAINKIKVRSQIKKKENERMTSTDIQTEIERYCAHDRKDLIQSVFELEQENRSLKEIVEEQQTEIQQIKKTALTKEQTTALLQELRGLEEKFEEAQKTKNYFKDEWKKAVREIHELRTEDHKQIQSQLQTHREELSQLSLDNLFAKNAEVVDRTGETFRSISGKTPDLDGFIASEKNYYRDPNALYQNLVAGYTFIHDW